MKVTRQQVLNEARKLLGVPYRPRGRSLLGLDCPGPMVYVAKRLGLSNYDVVGYSNFPGVRTLITALRNCKELEQIRVKDILEGDVIIFRMGKESCHMGFYMGNGYVLHAWNVAKKVVMNRIDESFESRISAAFRIKGVE